MGGRRREVPFVPVWMAHTKAISWSLGRQTVVQVVGTMARHPFAELDRHAHCQPSLPGPSHSHLNPLHLAGQVRVCTQSNSVSIPGFQPFLTSHTVDAGFFTSSRPCVRMWSLVWLGVVVSGWEEDRIPVSCPYSLSPRR